DRIDFEFSDPDAGYDDIPGEEPELEPDTEERPPVAAAPPPAASRRAAPRTPMLADAVDAVEAIAMPDDATTDDDIPTDQERAATLDDADAPPAETPDANDAWERLDEQWAVREADPDDDASEKFPDPEWKPFVPVEDLVDEAACATCKRSALLRPCSMCGER